ncbi:hypothetical protein U5801_04195 [Lamprobacter modestohalophilus]|nr:hypothetical protein [Lamprobacter modestohalophilus]MEA1049014.1 hypothetical protein [Lamprobacter modestohalophilus]
MPPPPATPFQPRDSTTYRPAIETDNVWIQSIQFAMDRPAALRP